MTFLRTIFLIAGLFFALAISANAVVRDNLPSSAPITFSNGATATTYDHCGDADLCAIIAESNGDELNIYSEGAAYCQPYLLHFVKGHNATTLFEFSRTLNHDRAVTTAFGTSCGNNQATQMTLDHGLVHLTVDEYNDGSLRFIFSATSPKH